MIRPFKVSLLLVVLVALGLGCGIDSVPLPGGTETNGRNNDGTGGDPSAGAGGTYGGGNLGSGQGGTVGSPPGDAIDIDVNGLFWSDEGAYVVLVGIDGAFPGAGTVTVTQTASGNAFIGSSTPLGSFAAAINAQLFDVLYIDFESPMGESATLTVTLQPGSVEAYAADDALENPAPGGSTPNLTAILIERGVDSPNVTLSVPAGTLAEGLLVIAASTETGVVNWGLVAPDGSFSITLQAAQGETVLVFAVEPAASNGGGTSVAVTAP